MTGSQLGDARQELRAGIRAALFGGAVYFSWLVNIGVLVGLGAWALADAKFSETADALWTSPEPGASGRAPLAALELGVARRLAILQVVGALALGSSLGVLASLWVGARRHRGLRSWLAVITVAALWLALLVSWRDLAWQGQQWRLRPVLDEFELLAAPLRDGWPSDDGELATLGPFMAYPHGKPRMLMLLTSPKLARSSLSFSAVERSSEGALRFQLTGPESGAWLEWHPSGGQPESFVGGVMVPYELQRHAPLGQGWHLARYDK